jgi:hypothetical protein
MRIALASALAGSLFLGAADDAAVPYPKEYRSWTFLHSSIYGAKQGVWDRPCEKPCTSGIFNFYANDQGVQGLRTGTFADGAVIAEELLELHGKDDGSAKEGPRRMVGVMVKDSKRYETTGGWGFGKYDGVTLVDQLGAGQRMACFQCHIPRKSRGYVFTEYRDR